MDKPADIPPAAWQAMQELREAYQGLPQQKHLHSIVRYQDLRLTWKRLGRPLTDEQWLYLMAQLASLPLTLNFESARALKEASRLADNISYHAISLREDLDQLKLLADRHDIPTSPVLDNLSKLIMGSSQENYDFLWWQSHTSDTAKPRFPEPGEVELKYQPKFRDMLSELANLSSNGQVLEEEGLSSNHYYSYSLIDWVRHFDRRFKADGIDRYFPEGWVLGATDLSRFLTAVSTGGNSHRDEHGKLPGEITIDIVNKARRAKS